MAMVVRTARLAAFSSTMRREFDDRQGCLDRLEPLPSPRVPTHVLVRGHFVPPEAGAFERMMRKLWLDWPTLVHIGAVQPVAGSGHYIQKDRQRAVVDAINAVARPRR